MDEGQGSRLSSALNGLAALGKACAALIVVSILTWHWDFTSRWLAGITHMEIFGTKLDRDAAFKKVSEIYNSQAKRDAGFDTDTGFKKLATAAISRAERVSPALSGARILWVDDDKDRNALEREVLEDMGIRVQRALSTDEALSYARSETFDLVISDLVRSESNVNTKSPERKCYAHFFRAPSGSGADAQAIAAFIASPEKNLLAGFALAEALAAEPNLKFSDPQTPRIIFYSAPSGGNAVNSCARIITNRPDVLLQSTISALEEFRSERLQSADGL